MKHRPNSLRLQDYDYSQAGAYFVTIVTKDRAEVLGRIDNQKMVLTEQGHIVDYFWNELPNRYDCITLDEYVIMPNHVHGIIIVGAIHESPLPVSRREMLLSKAVGYFKMNTAKHINIMNKTSGHSVW